MSDQVPSEMLELHAFVDDQLSVEDRRRVSTRLRKDAEARERSADYAALRDDIRALYGPVAEEPVPTRLRDAGRWPHRKPYLAVAAGLLLLLTGSWIGWHLPHGGLPSSASEAHIVQEVVSAYDVYTPDVEHPVEVSGEHEEHLVSWLSRRLGAPVVAARLDAQGYELLGGRLLSTEDGAGALLMYENTDGQRLILYMCENEQAGQSTSLRFAQEGDLSTVYWFDGPFSYAVAGKLSRERIMALAKALYKQIIL